MCVARITRFFLTLSAEYVGKDESGNAYYRKQTPAGERRRVIYAGLPEASKVPAPWYGWLHYTDDVPPSEGGPKKAVLAKRPSSQFNGHVRGLATRWPCSCWGKASGLWV